MTFSKNDTVYCDANFLVAYGAREVKQLDLKKRASVLFAKILASKCKLVASSLTFDETWLGIRRELGPKSVKKNLRFKISIFLEKLGLKFINSGTSEYSYSEVFNDLHFFTNKMLDHKSFSVIQFNDPKNGVKNALMNLNDFGLKPRDSFHLAYIKDNGITCFITNDSDFCKNKDKIKINIENF